MPVRKSTYRKIMARIRKEYPSYGLARRKYIINSIIYRRNKE